MARTKKTARESLAASTLPRATFPAPAPLPNVVEGPNDVQEVITPPLEVDSASFTFEVEDISGHYTVNSSTDYYLDWGKNESPSFENSSQLVDCGDLRTDYDSRNHGFSIFEFATFYLPWILMYWSQRKPITTLTTFLNSVGWRLLRMDSLFGCDYANTALDKMEKFLKVNPTQVTCDIDPTLLARHITNIVGRLVWKGTAYYFVVWNEIGLSVCSCGLWVPATGFANGSVSTDYFCSLTNGFILDEIGYRNLPDFVTALKKTHLDIHGCKLMLQSLGDLLSRKFSRKTVSKSGRKKFKTQFKTRRSVFTQKPRSTTPTSPRRSSAATTSRCVSCSKDYTSRVAPPATMCSSRSVCTPQPHLDVSPCYLSDLLVPSLPMRLFHSQSIRWTFQLPVRLFYLASPSHLSHLLDSHQPYYP